MHATLTFVYWKNTWGLLPCLGSKAPLTSSARSSCEGKVTTNFSAWVSDKHVRVGKGHWVSCRSETCSCRRRNTCVGNHTCKEWRDPGTGKIPCTGELHPSFCLCTIIIQCLCQQLCSHCISLESSLCFCSQSPTAFGPEWEVKL